MKMLGLTVGDERTGSSWFRLYQYIPLLQRHGWNVDVAARAHIDTPLLAQAQAADWVWNQKNLFSRSAARQLRRASRRLAFDFDDAIYTRPGKPYSRLTQWRVSARLRYQLRHADLVTVASHYLKNYAEQYTERVIVLPMALNLEEWPLANAAIRPNKRITIGWAGAPHNLVYLERMEAVLAELLARHPQVCIAVFSGRPPRWSLPTHYVPFEKGQEPAFVAGLDIGLLPLREDEFTRGKSPIKALQYMACGIPVVGKVFGAGKEMLGTTHCIAIENDTDWLPALETLINDPARRTTMGHAGREFVIAHHSVEAVGSQLIAALTSASP